MPSDEDTDAGTVHQSISPENDAYVAGRDNIITQHIYPVGTIPLATAVGAEDPHGGDDPWTRTARDHVAWQKAAAMPGRDELQAASLSVIMNLHRQHADALEVCRDDPWLDEEFPVRMAEEVGTLLRELPEGLLLSPAEAALLTVVPFLRATRWVVNASRLRPSGSARTWLSIPRHRERGASSSSPTHTRGCLGHPQAHRTRRHRDRLVGFRPMARPGARQGSEPH